MLGLIRNTKLGIFTVYSHDEKDPELIDNQSGDFTYIFMANLNAQKRQITFWEWQDYRAI